MNIKYFEKPTQVKFYNETDGRFLGGIGYKDFIICGECGCVLNLSDVYDSYQETIKEPVKILNWIDISYAIIED